MAELVRGYGVQVYRAGDRIQRRVANREAKAVRGFGVELDVVVQDGSGFVKARREFDVAVAVRVGADGDRVGDVGISIPVNVIPIQKSRIRDQTDRRRRRDRPEAGGSAERQLVDEIEPDQPRICGRPGDPHVDEGGRDLIPGVERSLQSRLGLGHRQHRRAERVRDRVQRVVYAVFHRNAASVPFDADQLGYQLPRDRGGLSVGDVKGFKRATSLNGDHVCQRQTEAESKGEYLFLYVLHSLCSFNFSSWGDLRAHLRTVAN